MFKMYFCTQWTRFTPT